MDYVLIIYKGVLIKFQYKQLYLVVAVVTHTFVIVGEAFDFEHVQFHRRQINGNAEKPNQYHQVQKPLKNGERQ